MCGGAAYLAGYQAMEKVTGTCFRLTVARYNKSSIAWHDLQMSDVDDLAIESVCRRQRLRGTSDASGEQVVATTGTRQVHYPT
jgi:hypothetical protein